MRFNPDFIEKVRDANNIAEIVSQWTELKGGGGRLMGRCPFPSHLDKSPSFSVDETRQLFHCFGCKKGGDVFKLLEEYNGVSFPEAVEFLARRASIPLPEPEPGQRRPGGASYEAKELFLKLNREAAVFWHRQLKSLPAEHPALAYLAKRGIAPEIVDAFRIGVALEEWEGLAGHLRSRKAPLEAAEALGLLRKRKNASGYFDLFRERVIFPIFSPTGEVVGFGGRAYGDGTPKYLNSPESAVFSKGRTFYGLHESGRYIRSSDEAIVVEGYMDAIALHAAGLKNVVAILGTAFTADHAKTLKRYAANVKMLLDGDDAGMNAAERSLPVLLHGGLAAKGLFLPEKHDPDDYVREKGAAHLRGELDRAPELFSLIVARHMRGYTGSPSEKVRIVDELAPIFRSTPNPQLVELYWLELSQRLDVSVDWIRKAALAAGRMSPSLGGAKPAMKEPASAPDEIRPDLTEEAIEIVSLKGAPRDEAFVLSLALHNGTLIEAVRDQGFLEFVSHPGVKRLLSLALNHYGQRPAEFAKLAASLAHQTDQPQVLTSSLEIVRSMSARKNLGDASGARAEGLPTDGDSSETTDALLKVLNDYMTAVRRRHLKNQAKQLANQIRNEASAEKLPDKLEQIMNLVRDRHSLDRG